VSSTRPRLVLLVGAPRSGTTWLQSLLGAHPCIATPQETDLFSRYIRPLADAWSWQLRGGPDAWKQRRYKGLPGVLTTEEFAKLVSEVIDSVLDGIARLEPDATVLLEKSPSHSTCADVVAAYAPEVRVIHLVRDGRDVTASLVGAADGWGRGWAPRTIKDAARAWVENVRGAQQYRKLGFVYREVRYEALAEADPEVLRGVYAFCGFDVDVDECARLYKQYGLDAMRDGAEDPIVLGGEFAAYSSDRTEPAGFFGKGGVGGWRDSWSTDDLLLFRSIAGPLLEQLGYEPNGRWAASPSRTFAYKAEVAARRAVAGVARRVGRAGDRVVKDLP
jgi:Sulfotransferase family